MGIESNRNISTLSQSISRREFLKLASATAAGLLIGYKSAQGADAALCLINGLLIDGTGADAIPDGAVVIQDGRILVAGPRSQVMVPSSAKIVDTAHKRGKTVTAHVTSARDLERALDAGVDEIAHMVVDTLSEKLISRMVEAGIRWVPTLELWQGVSRRYAVSHGSTAIKNLALFVKAGGEVVLGTDYAGAPLVNFDLGMPIHEIEWMQEAGMTPMQIIVAATRNGARSCDMVSELGTLEAGKIADVLVVDGNPLADIHALTKVRLVLREGKSIETISSD